MKQDCKCPEPVEDRDPNRPRGRCVKCSKFISPAWSSNDRSVKAFYDRLEEALFPWNVIHAANPSDELLAFREFRRQCEERENAGRERFGHAHLQRDNAEEAKEEAADLSNYCHFTVLNEIRDGKDPDWSLSLTAARFAYEAHRVACALSDHKHQPISNFPQT